MKVLLGLGLLGLAMTMGAKSPTKASPKNDSSYFYGENLVANGDFSLAAGSYKIAGKFEADQWFRYDGNNGEVVLTTDPTNPDNTVLQYVKGGFQDAACFLNAVPAGTVLLGSFDYYIPAGGTTDNIGFHMFEGAWSHDGNIFFQPDVDFYHTVVTDGANGWKHVSFTHTAAGSLDTFMLWGNCATTDLYFDNFDLHVEGQESIFAGRGDLELFRDRLSSELGGTPNEDGLYGKNAALKSGYVELAANGLFGMEFDEELVPADYQIDVSLKEAAVEVSVELQKADGTAVVSEKVSETSLSKLISVKSSDAITKMVVRAKNGANVDLVSLRKAVKRNYDPSKTYYVQENLTQNGDFEKFDEGLRFTEEQAEGAWGSVVSYDLGATIKSVGGSKCAVIEKDASDTHVYGSMFLMTPDTLEIGDILRFEYDFKLTKGNPNATYPEVDCEFVGGANVKYYTINMDQEVLETYGAEANHYPVTYTTLANGFKHVSMTFEVCNDMIQWNSIRWLFSLQAAGDQLAIDNVALSLLTDVEPTNPVTKIEITGGDIELTAGATKDLAVVLTPADHDETTLTWSSSKTSVATVDNNGKVTAVAEGSAEITVTTSEGVKTSIIVVVTAAEAPAKKGCGGSIVTASVIVSVVACAGALLLIKSKKRRLN